MEANNPSDKICLHCKAEGVYMVLLAKNFARHLKEQHNTRYQELRVEGKQRCKQPEFNKDYLWKTNDEVQVEEPAEEDIVAEEQKPRGKVSTSTQNQKNPKQLQYQEEEKQMTAQNENELTYKSERKRDKKLEEKLDISFQSLNRRSAARVSVGNMTNYSAFMDTRISQVEDENQALRNELNQYKTQQQELIQQVTQQNEIIMQLQNSMKVLQNISSLPMQWESSTNPTQQQPSLIEVRSAQSSIPDQKKLQSSNCKDLEKIPIQKRKAQPKGKDESKPQFEWKTWINLDANEEQSLTTGDNNFKVQGEERNMNDKSGINFTDIVQKLYSAQKQELDSEDYNKEVTKQIRGCIIKQGFKIGKVIGAGNLGTTVQAEDLQKKESVILKLYHAKNTQPLALNEFKMLHYASHCPSIVKVHSLMYNTRGQFVAISMEDLSSYQTLYQYCLEAHDAKSSLMVARNLCRAVAELHAIKLIHGDLNSGNVMINQETQDVKLIDFDSTSIEGTKVRASGNEDFVSEDMWWAIDRCKKVEAKTFNDLYSLAICLYMLIGDTEKKFFKSLTAAESMPYDESKKLITSDTFMGNKVVLKIMSGVATAEEGALALHEVISNQR